MKKGSQRKLIGFFALLSVMILAIHFSDAQTQKPSHLFDLIEASELKAENDGMLNFLESEAQAKSAVTVHEDAKKL